ncbi:hypothetical protein BCR44DRAFT_40871 [Catenaria anguillulae PL171]|uniref:EF-hand domain-containing protein n=1 Tax=Catenaria anguillulae PL171 TaxID=765915 RepID=A0A1Y2HR35_9FUNG|nr:hypothetical protein BCR44DRAFT_40871 [Catenaria anguillulae PL171]
MGHSPSKPSQEPEVSETVKAHFTSKEIHKLHADFAKVAADNGTITKAQFMTTIHPYVSSWTAGNIFLERLFDAFDSNGDHEIDFNEFVEGLSIFSRGTPEEKVELSFKLYDINRDGYVTQRELYKITSQLYSAFYNEDQSQRIKEMVARLFDDLDVNGDGQLSLTEFKLQAMKEPMITDFLQQFLAEPASQPVPIPPS